MNSDKPVMRQMLEASLVVGLLLLYVWLKFSKRDHDQKGYRKLPPGPRPWPIVGSFHLLGHLFHQDFKKLSDFYGPIFHLRLGSVAAIVISSPTLAEEVLKTKDLTFASRSRSSFATIVFYDDSNAGFSPYGPHWRHARKLYALELLTVRRIRQFEKERTAELLRGLHSIINGCRDGKAIGIDHVLWTIISNNISRMTLSKTFYGDTSRTASAVESRVFDQALKDVLRLSIAPVLGDFIPFLRKFDIGGYKKQMSEVSKQMDEILETIIEERRQITIQKSSADAEGNKEQDLADVLLSTASSDKENPLTREQVKGLLLEVLAAGIETQVTTLSWAFSELLKNPSVLAKAQEELDNIIGKDQLVQEADLPRLPYIQAIMKETFRLHPIGPLLIPRMSTEATTLGNGYYIPKNARVFVNTWAMMRDPSLWENPLEFSPERFLKTDIDTSGRAFKYLPFGSGRRTCPGRPLALTMMQYSLAALLHACSWALPQGMNPDDVDMREGSGVAVPRLIPLEIVASPRLPLSVIFSAR